MNETLHGFTIRGGKIVIAVTSNGCTTAEQFRIDTVSGVTGMILTVVRTEPDMCKAFIREPVLLEFALPDDVKGVPFTVQNLFAQGRDL